jgi:hypothetical protein
MEGLIREIKKDVIAADMYAGNIRIVLRRLASQQNLSNVVKRDVLDIHQNNKDGILALDRLVKNIEALSKYAAPPTLEREDPPTIEQYLRKAIHHKEPPQLGIHREEAEDASLEGW